MNRLIKVSTLLMALFIIGCEDNDAENNNMIIYEVTTEDVSSGPYYFNFASGKKDNSAWHLSYANVDAGQGFSMPSISLHSSVMLTVDNASKFEDIEKSPSPETKTTVLTSFTCSAMSRVIPTSQSPLALPSSLCT